MIGIPKTGTLEHCWISANVNTGFRFTTADGRPVRLAVVDDQDNVIEAGDTLSSEAWNVCIDTMKKFMVGMGHIVVHSGPPGALVPEQRVSARTKRVRASQAR